MDQRMPPLGRERVLELRHQSCALWGIRRLLVPTPLEALEVLSHAILGRLQVRPMTARERPPSRQAVPLEAF
jgi:hypothetical protein